MPATGFLKQEQKEKLQKNLKEHEHPEIRERIWFYRTYCVKLTSEVPS